MKAYKATGAVITAARRLLGLRLTVSGTEHLGERTTLYVVNHFTRLETILIPYAIFHAKRKPVHTLATGDIFRGVMKRYLAATGVMSTRDRQRNRTIIRDLATGAASWVIYPEGGLVKSRRTVRRGRLFIERTGRSGPPHTGAAVLALKAAMVKRRLRYAAAKGDPKRLAYYRQQYDLTDAAQLDERELVIVPVTITYHGLRPGQNPVRRLVRWLKKDLDPRVDEELQVEGRLLFGRGEINVHFGMPIPVADHLVGASKLARRMTRLVSEARAHELVGRQARRLTDAAMRQLYGGIEISFERIFAYALRATRSERIDASRLHRALFVAASELRGRGEIRLRPDLRSGISALVTGADYPPLDVAVANAERDGVLRRERDAYVIDRERLDDPADLHRVRLDCMTQVHANEVESVRAVREVVDHALGLSDTRLRRKIADSMYRRVRAMYEMDRSAVPHDDTTPAEYGKPFLLAPRRRGGTGVVLVHGYLACPQEMRPLGAHLAGDGHTVLGVRLPGHGTSHEQLALVDLDDWLDAVRRGVATLRERCDAVVLCGFSLGGLLALLTAALTPDLAGVVSINAVMGIRDRRAHFVPALVHGHRLLRAARLARGRPTASNARTESPDTHYLTSDLGAVHEVRRAMRRARRDLGAYRGPALVVQSTGDHVVDPSSGRRIADLMADAETTLLEPEIERHNIMEGAGSAEVLAAIGAFVRRVGQADRRAAG